MKKEMIAETLGYGCYHVQVFRQTRDASARPQFRHMITYQVEVNGEVKHSGISAEEAMKHLASMINTVTHKLSKAGMTV